MSFAENPAFFRTVDQAQSIVAHCQRIKKGRSGTIQLECLLQFETRFFILSGRKVCDPENHVSRRVVRMGRNPRLTKCNCLFDASFSQQFLGIRRKEKIVPVTVHSPLRICFRKAVVENPSLSRTSTTSPPSARTTDAPATSSSV